jgi:DNA polymerase elongation subunit (family B)
MTRVLAAESLLEDPLLGGADRIRGVVAVEHVEGDPSDAMALFIRRDGRTVEERVPFEPFLVMEGDWAGRCPIAPVSVLRLEGPGALNRLARYATWRACQKARQWVAKESGIPTSGAQTPCLFISDPVQQYLTIAGRTLFGGMRFDDLRRLQVDIECVVSEGHEFCNPEREGDRIVAIGLGDDRGGALQLGAPDMGERELIERFVDAVRERDPDVIEGHNLFNFDLPYLAERARRHRVRLALGRDGSVPSRRPSRFTAGDRTIAYDRFDIHGRHVVDTLFLVHAYDVIHRSLDGFGLKAVAVHFGVAAPDRTYLDPGEIGSLFRDDPARVLRYLADDVLETGRVGRLISGSYFIQARMLPFGYQSVCVRGNAAKIDALMVREYLRRGRAIPKPGEPRPFAGATARVFVRGVVRNVHHCDVRSLYPSLMLTRKLAPACDPEGVFLDLLDVLRRLRLEAKSRSREAAETEAAFLEAMQSAFKVLINSFYGYLGFSQARFADFDAAERVAAGGREILDRMLGWLREHGAEPVEMDTDGVYFVPPEQGGRELQAFRERFAASLPAGIEVEFDGVYPAMFSYQTKNYALLAEDGEVVVRGATLKSRGLEPFQRAFLREFVRLKLEGKDAELASLTARYEKAIRDGAWPIRHLAKTETLQEAPAVYAAKVGRSGRGRNAAYELALRSGREFRAGDQISYYVTGHAAGVSVWDHAKPVSAWDPKARDENVKYYLAKLRALHEKFVEGKGGEDDAEGAES